MYRAFADAEFLCRAPYGFFILNYICPQYNTSFSAAVFAALIFFHEYVHPQKLLSVEIILFCKVYAPLCLFMNKSAYGFGDGNENVFRRESAVSCQLVTESRQRSVEFA